VLAHPGHRRHALRHHNKLERKFHRRHYGMARPHWRYGRYPYRYGYRYGRAGAPGQPATATAYSAPATPGYSGPHYTGAAPGAATGAPARGTYVQPGQVVGGQCSCGTAAQTAYCACCGQPLR
jgi:hypothetical protein